MTCTACGAANKPGRKFCVECGTSLAAACTACGSPYEPGERFCGECGTPLPGAAAAPTRVPAAAVPSPAAPSGAEVRQVSVLFCDLVAFTTLSEGRDAEDMRELLSGYFDAARRIVERYGGVVEKFIGDAVMAVWGSPVAREDDAERAVRAALELVTEVGQFGERVGVTLQARAGVVTGQAASWANPGEGLVVGDRVNTAARVQGEAAPETVYVDDLTKQITAASISYADAGRHEVKGKVDPLQLWRALRVVAGKGGAQRIDGLEAPFGGRSRELNLVKELFHTTVEDGRARLLAVSGQAGVGKSRLRWEFDKYVDGLAFDVWWHSGRCLSYGEGVAYWALSEMVRQRLGIAEEDPNEVATERLAAGLDRYVQDPAVRDYVRPALAALIGTEDPGLPREELFAGWRLFFEVLAAQQPVVLVFEDMHWADVGLLDFVEQLLDWSASHPIFVLSFARPELSERRPDWAAGRRNATPLYLDALPDVVMSQILTDLVPGLPNDVAARIVDRAEGIPLYAVEMIRGLIDRDIVVPREGVYRLVGQVGDLDLPASLTALIGARLDALEAGERSLVRQVTVLGGTFPRAAMTAISEIPESQLDGLLHSLMRKEILTVQSDPLSPERGQYAFVQSLMRTVAYDTLSRHERKALHAGAADHLRAAFPNDGEDVVEVVASHYRDAYDAAGSDPEADSLRANAVTMFTRAAGRAKAVGAPESAEAAFRTAAELCADESDAAGLLQSAGDMAMTAGHADAAFDYFSQAQAAHAAAGRDREALLLATRVARARAIGGHLDDALGILRGTLDRMDDDDPERAEVLVGLARAAVFAGTRAEADESAERAMKLAQDYELPDIFISAASIKALILSLQDRPAEALMLYTGALAQLGEDGDIEMRLGLHGNCGDLLLQSDQPGADAHCKAVIDLGSRIGDRPYYGIGTANLMLWHLLRGEWEEVDRLGTQLMATGWAVTPLAATHLVTLSAWRGDMVAAAEHLEHIAPFKASDDVQDRTMHAATRGLVALHEGEFAEALGAAGPAAEEALASFGIRIELFRLAWPVALEAALRAGHLDRLDELLALVARRPIGQLPPYLRAQMARFTGLAQNARGRHDEVEQSLRRATEILDGLAYRYFHAIAETDLAEWLLGQQREAEATPLLTHAAGVFDELRAQPQRARVQRLDPSTAHVGS